MGASYAAALVTWTESVAPGTFAAYYASSGPVQAVEDFWQYYSPIVKGMPRNCSEDLFEFIAYMDRVFKIGSPKAQTALKDEFGLGSLRNDDFSATIAYGLWLWQANTFAASSGFADFCDSIEGLYNDPVLKLPPRLGRSSVPSGTLVRTFNGYSKWVRTVLLPNFCSFYRYPAGSLECLDTYSPDNFIYKDAELVDNRADRQWEWMLCNEPLGFRFG